MSTQLPGDFYKEQLAAHTSALQAGVVQIGRLSRLRLLVALATVPFIIVAFRNNLSWPWWPVGVLVIIFLLLVRLSSRLTRRQARTGRYIAIIEDELDALAGTITAFADGAEYIDPTHPYSYDLDLFGQRSIYQLLARTVTRQGGIRLAEALKEGATDEQIILQKQQTVRELGTLPQPLLDFRVDGASTPEAEGDHANLIAWLQGEDHFINDSFVRAAAVAAPIITIGLILYSILTSTAFFALPFIVNRLIQLRFTKRIREADSGIGKTAPLVQKYGRLLQRIATQQFETDSLKKMSSECLLFGPQLTHFSRQASAFSRRNDTMGGLFLNYLFLYDFISLLRLEGWRKSHRDTMLASIDSIIDFDVAVSGATYAFNNPEHVFPTITGNRDAPVIEGHSLRHPLLPPDAIANSFVLGRTEQFYLLTGANMTGKSTFMRTLGASLVMAYAGLPVPALSLTLPLLQIFTSMRITDSVQDDISYFKAELLRIKTLTDSLGRGALHHLVFLDEPLRGTNSADKQKGTSAIIETLLGGKAIGVIATHDTELCSDVAEGRGQLSNYHFESTVTEEGLAFDYTLRPGVSTSNNATVLMRQMGIIR